MTRASRRVSAGLEDGPRQRAGETRVSGVSVSRPRLGVTAAVEIAPKASRESVHLGRGARTGLASRLGGRRVVAVGAQAAIPGAPARGTRCIPSSGDHPPPAVAAPPTLRRRSDPLEVASAKATDPAGELGFPRPACETFWDGHRAEGSAHTRRTVPSGFGEGARGTGVRCAVSDVTRPDPGLIRRTFRPRARVNRDAFGKPDGTLSGGVRPPPRGGTVPNCSPDGLRGTGATPGVPAAGLPGTRGALPRREARPGSSWRAAPKLSPPPFLGAAVR